MRGARRQPDSGHSAGGVAPCVAAVAVALAASALAQDANPVVTSNQPYFTVSRTLDPRTGQPLAWPASVPAAYVAGAGAAGVRPGTWRWRVLPGPTHLRLEPRQLAGVTHAGRNSAATQGANLSSYLFPVALWPTRPSPSGGLLPDLAAPAYVALPRQTGGGGTLQYVVRTTFAPVATSFLDVALTLRYQGGERDDKDANAGAGPSQCPLVSFHDGPTPYPTDGHYDEDGLGTWRLNTSPEAVLWATWMERQPVGRVHSDWGMRRTPPLVPELRGEGIGSYYSDLWSRHGDHRLGFDLWAGAGRAGDLAFALLEVGPLRIGGFPFAGQLLEVDPTTPAFGLLQSTWVGLVDGNGQYRGAKVSLPRLPGARGTYLGLEYALFDAGFALAGTSGAQWVRID